jgi:hypothetical protein
MIGNILTSIFHYHSRRAVIIIITIYRAILYPTQCARIIAKNPDSITATIAWRPSESRALFTHPRLDR